MATLFTYQDMTFWAEHGMVAVEDRRKDAKEHIAPITFRERAWALFREAKVANHNSDKRMLAKCARDMISCAQEAEQQGCPLDPMVAQEQAVRQRRVYASLTGLNVPTSRPKAALSTFGIDSRRK